MATVFKEPVTTAARQFLTTHSDLIAPDILPVEIANALTRAVRKSVFSGQLVASTFALLRGLVDVRHASQPLLERALVTSISLHHHLFDCLYVSLAEEKGCDLVTVDGTFARKLASSGSLVRVHDLTAAAPA
jgi:predicted nucleic acid-binding protein